MYYGRYFDWLCEQINLKPGTYDILVHELHRLNFEWVLDLDENRAEDGIILRGNFHENNEYFETIEDKPCSILEMLIGLAQKMDYTLDDDDRGDRTRIWFWEMVFNLGLKEFTDKSFDRPFSDDFERLMLVQNKCYRWMNREFGYDGFGSPFPLNKPHRDQRTITLIDQMNDYILEKYIYKDEVL